MLVYIVYPGGYNNRILSYLLYPLYASNYRNGIFFCRNDQDLWDAVRRHGKAPVVVTGGNPTLRDNRLIRFLLKIRNADMSVSFFDTSPNPRSIKEPVVRLVNNYFKQSVYKNVNLYKKNQTYGTAWMDWYAKCVGSPDRIELRHTTPLSDGQISKIRLSWNIGYGLYPRTAATKRIPPYIAKYFGPKPVRLFMRKGIKPMGKKDKEIRVHARMNKGEPGTVLNIHRSHFLHRLNDVFAIESEKVPRSVYNWEFKSAAAVLSPFGSGEVCYRDFESALYGAALIKPNMSHLVTRPNIYSDHEYIPLTWCGGNMESAIEEALSRRYELANSAFESMQSWYSRFDEITEHFLHVSSRLK